MPLELRKAIDLFAAPTPRADRPAIFLELTRSVCPVCRKNIDARILIRDGRLVMEKRCAEHGAFEALLLSDADWYLRSMKFNKPGSIPVRFNTETRTGCPGDCGICPDHQQHTCLAILEITDRCNLGCGQCFAASSEHSGERAGSGFFMDLDEARRRIENAIACEGKLEVLQISGGEPTVHPRLLEIVRLAKDMGIASVMVNTNGIRIAEDEHLADQLAAVEPTPPSVYLQFDGFKDDFYTAIRGRPLLDVKMKAIERLTARGIKVALVSTIMRGWNEDQVGAICDFAIRNPGIRSVNFQPAFSEGRVRGGFDPMDRVTLTDIFQRAEEQTGGMLRKSDFVPVPCPFPSCSGLTYVFYDEGKATPITRLIDVEDYLDFLSNRTMLHLSDDIFRSLKSLFSFSVEGGSLPMVENFCTACGITLPRIDSLAEKVTMIGSMSFMDGYTFDWKRAMKCCVHELAAADRIVPFCDYNTIHRNCGG
jgi:uncharacterized radical SAM superfamily Fe-S cluster-containing enzyme